MLEGQAFDATPLLDAFDHFVAGVTARRGPFGQGLGRPPIA
jgi:hypothetical protein